MRRFLCAAMTVLAACSDAPGVLDPVAANATTTEPMTARTTIDGVEYEYGCPDFPCPVTQLVKQHVDQHLWFWLPPGTFTKPTIYLYILRVPVQLRVATPPTVILPPVITPPPPAPSLLGPTEWTGKPNSGGHITCSGFKLTLDSPDGGPWDFVTGEIVYEYGIMNSVSNVFTPNGLTTTVGINATGWALLLAGNYPLVAPYPNFEFRARFKVNLERPPHTATVEHSFICRLAPPPPPPTAPPAPSLTGPTDILGTRPLFNGPLVCSNVHFTLISPDNGSWSFVDGQREIEFLEWDGVKKGWFPSGNKTTSALTQTSWDQLLAGTYTLSPGVKSGPYMATFTITVERSVYQHTITHSLVCGGQDYFGN